MSTATIEVHEGLSACSLHPVRPAFGRYQCYRSEGPLHGGVNEAVMHTFDEIGIRPLSAYNAYNIEQRSL